MQVYNELNTKLWIAAWNVWISWWSELDGRRGGGFWCWNSGVLVNRTQIGQLVRSSGGRPRFLPPQRVGGKYVQTTPIRQRCLMFMNPALLLKSYYRVLRGNNGTRANSSVRTGCQNYGYDRWWWSSRSDCCRFSFWGSSLLNRSVQELFDTDLVIYGLRNNDEFSSPR